MFPSQFERDDRFVPGVASPERPFAGSALYNAGLSRCVTSFEQSTTDVGKSLSIVIASSPGLGLIVETGPVPVKGGDLSSHRPGHRDGLLFGKKLHGVGRPFPMTVS